jgi:hypothetical protein
MPESFIERDAAQILRGLPALPPGLKGKKHWNSGISKLLGKGVGGPPRRANLPARFQTGITRLDKGQQAAPVG